MTQYNFISEDLKARINNWIPAGSSPVRCRGEGVLKIFIDFIS
jgi:hypothetical protein